jgi:hypothetical protein
LPVPISVLWALKNISSFQTGGDALRTENIYHTGGDALRFEIFHHAKT